MKTTYILLVACMLLVAACATGSYQVIGKYDPTEQSFNGVVVQSGSKGNCPPLPATFQESDLVGIWHTYWNETGMMTVTIKADGTFKQVYDYPPLNYYYEGDWHTWKLERRDDGPSYVHFDGMLVCGRMCGHSLGGTWYDSCGQRMITMKENEVVLLLTSVVTEGLSSKLAAPRGIEMFEPVLDPDTLPVIYQLEH